MNDLIHKIVGTIIAVGQSDVGKFRLGETIRYTPSEILEILKQHENDIFGKEPSTQTNTSNTLDALDCVSKQAVIKAVDKHTFDTDEGLCLDEDITCILEEIPSAQPNMCKYWDNESSFCALHRPSAQPERKKGEWLRHPAYKQKDFREWDVCSVCGVGCRRRRYEENPDGTEYETIYGYKYCPNCGAKMEV